MQINDEIILKHEINKNKNGGSMEIKQQSKDNTADVSSALTNKGKEVWKH